MRFRKEGQTALGNEIDTAPRHRPFNHIQVIIKADAEIGIVPAYYGPQAWERF